MGEGLLFLIILPQPMPMFDLEILLLLVIDPVRVQLVLEP